MAVSTRGVIVAGIVTGIALFVANGTGSSNGSSNDNGAASTTRSTPVVPERIEIPALNIRAPLMKLGLSDDGEVELPPFDRPSTAGWYTGSAVPGDPGASVIIGHVDTKTAPAVFFRLGELRAGAVVKVRRSDGRTASYRVESVEHVAKDSFPAERVYTEDGLRLITCGGAFDWSQREYRDNIIVYASPTRAA